MSEALDNVELETGNTPRLLPVDVESRRLAVAPGGPWAALADELAGDLAVLMHRELPIPEQKARMTRVGGRCPVHGSYLEFDPWSPHAHLCAACGQAYVGREHDDWWAMGAQLWTVERAVHAATLYLLRGDEVHAALASKILSELADRYLEYPNRDNVLGPSRPFFSTYLESIWLLNICHALDLLETAGAPQVAVLGRSLRQRVIRPSSQLIAGFHEGTSNRQVWNEVAVLSALHTLQDDASMMLRLDSRGGLPWLMTHGLLEDGTWFEGENYHVFAHRGLWYGVNLLRARVAAGHDDFVLPENLERRFKAGYLTPFLGLLPDDTLPSRRDSPYAVSVRQWRFAEWCELGYADTGNRDLAAMLSHLYAGAGHLRNASRDIHAADGSTPRPVERASERSRSLADVERNTPAQSLSRSSLSWRALLCAPLEPVPEEKWEPASVCLPSQGLAVLRRNQGIGYVALEGGHTGGGHGHPDALSLTLQTGAERWLDDPGTGSYVDRSLHWHRSTLAHHAPLINGESQQPAESSLEAFEDRGAVGWIVKSATGLADGVSITRTIVACENYLVDVLDWSGSNESELTLPIAGNGSLANTGKDLRPSPSPGFLAASGGAGGLEDGFDFASNVASSSVAVGQIVQFDARPAYAESKNLPLKSDFSTRLWYSVLAAEGASGGRDVAILTRASVPGAPTHDSQERYWLSAKGSSGRIVGVWAWSSPEARASDVLDVALGDATLASVGTGTTATPGALVSVTTADGTRAVHSFSENGWAIDLLVGTSRSHIDLIRGEALPEAPQADAEVQAGSADPENENLEDEEMLLEADFVVPFADDDLFDDSPGDQIEGALLIPLGSSNYLGTEQSWEEAGEPFAMLQLARTDTLLIADIEVSTGLIVSPGSDGEGGYHNPLDNEPADINADGLQWYIGKPDSKHWSDAALCLPTSSSEAAADSDEGAEDSASTARYRRIENNGSTRFVAHWKPIEDGWAMRLEWPIDDLPVDEDGCIAFDLVVNERPAERERRRGQLVLSGGGGFSYLRGDRHSPHHALIIAVT